MRPPEELFIKGFLPNLRGALTHALRKRGYSQLKIASFLNVTQAAVSQYLASPYDSYLAKLEVLGLPKNDVEALIDTLVKDVELGPIHVTETLMHSWRNFLSKGYLCGYHREMYPELAGCEICISYADHMVDAEKALIIRRLEEATRMLENNSLVIHVVPEVGINIAERTTNPRDSSDIAAIPGRMVRVKDVVRAVSRPSFGASRHLAAILLAVKEYSSDVRAVINLKHDANVQRALRKSGMKYASTNHKKDKVDEEEVVSSVAYCFSKNKDLEAVIDRGGIGLEAATYIFGRDAIEVARKALKIARLVASKLM